jgi:hypothetical protein
MRSRCGDQNRQRLYRGELANLLQHRESVKMWHVQIEDDEVRIDVEQTRLHQSGIHLGERFR